MSQSRAIDYENASDAVRAVYDEIKTLRKVDRVNNFWTHIAVDEKMLRRIWNNVKEVMAPGALDPLVKELIYIAVSVTNNCRYCIASHRAGAIRAGMTEEQFNELMAVVALANETNRLAIGYNIPIDPQFEQ
ncbi:carboxymuconolactone decarboxylase family protein [Daeguia caeni]|uniref:Carboxymuconolactone decarboxylase family protein n=1 Tax=Daeguia caeni TaxID=439612 RepID=A0ABV9HC42_9HYPH